MIIIQQAVWLYHPFTPNDRGVQELLHQRGIQISHEGSGKLTAVG